MDDPIFDPWGHEPEDGSRTPQKRWHAGAARRRLFPLAPPPPAAPPAPQAPSAPPVPSAPPAPQPPAPPVTRRLEARSAVGSPVETLMHGTVLPHLRRAADTLRRAKHEVQLQVSFEAGAGRATLSLRPWCGPFRESWGEWSEVEARVGPSDPAQAVVRCWHGPADGEPDVSAVIPAGPRAGGELDTIVLEFVRATLRRCPPPPTFRPRSSTASATPSRSPER